jgi:hypothetical protein
MRVCACVECVLESVCACIVCVIELLLLPVRHRCDISRIDVEVGLGGLFVEPNGVLETHLLVRLIRIHSTLSTLSKLYTLYTLSTILSAQLLHTHLTELLLHTTDIDVLQEASKAEDAYRLVLAKDGDLVATQVADLQDGSCHRGAQPIPEPVGYVPGVACVVKVAPDHDLLCGGLRVCSCAPVLLCSCAPLLPLHDSSHYS